MSGRLVMERPKWSEREGQIECQGAFAADGDRHTYFVRWPGDARPSPSATGDAMLCFSLLCAMRQGLDLHIEAPVSERLLYQSHELQGVFGRWYPDRFQRIKVTVEDTEAFEAQAPATGGGALATFTGGADSLFTLMQNREAISHLLYVHGFDVKLRDTAHRELAGGCCREAASDTGVASLEVESDLRHYTDLHTNWLTELHGSALAGIGHLLSASADRLLISSSNQYERLMPMGSDPLLDPMFSGRELEVEHYGSHLSRIEKLDAIADWPTAVRLLRVCGANEPGQANCGRCEKCLRTMVALMTVGKLENFAGRFSAPFDFDRLGKLEVPLHRETAWVDWSTNLTLLEEDAPTPELERLRGFLREKSDSRKRVMLNRKLRPDLHTVVASEPWRARWPKFRRKILRSIEQRDPAWLRSRIENSLPALKGAALAKLGEDRKWLRRKLRKTKWAKRLDKLPWRRGSTGGGRD